MTEPRVCDECGEPLPLLSRSDRTFCSRPCRQRWVRRERPDDARLLIGHGPYSVIVTYTDGEHGWKTVVGWAHTKKLARVDADQQAKWELENGWFIASISTPASIYRDLQNHGQFNANRAGQHARNSQRTVQT